MQLYKHRVLLSHFPRFGCFSSAPSTLVPAVKLSKIATRLLFTEQCSLCPSSVNKDLSTTESSYLPTSSSKFMCGLDFDTATRRAKRFLSSLSFTSLSSSLMFASFPLLFHTWSWHFFIGAHRLTLIICMRLETIRRIPQTAGCQMLVAVRQYDMTAFVTKLYSCSLSFVNVFVKPARVQFRAVMIRRCLCSAESESAR